MVVVVRDESRSSKDRMHVGQVLNLAQSQEGQWPSESNVTHPKGSSIYQGGGDLHLANSEQGWVITNQFVGASLSGPVFISWSIPVGSGDRKYLVTADASKSSASNVLRVFISSHERDSFRSTSEIFPYSDSRWLLGVAEGENAIVTVMRLCGLTAIADRLSRFRALVAEDPEEPDLDIESLRSFADFFIQESRLPDPVIGAGPEGFLEAEWRIPSNVELMAASTSANWVFPEERYWGDGDGILAMKFLPNELIQYAAVSGPAGRGKERLRTSGILPKNDIMTAIQTFTSRLAVQ